MQIDRGALCDSAMSVVLAYEHTRVHVHRLIGHDRPTSLQQYRCLATSFDQARFRSQRSAGINRCRLSGSTCGIMGIDDEYEGSLDHNHVTSALQTLA